VTARLIDEQCAALIAAADAALIDPAAAPASAERPDAPTWADLAHEAWVTVAARRIALGGPIARPSAIGYAKAEDFTMRIKGHPATSLSGRVPDAVIAAVIGCTPEGVAYHRRALGLPAVGDDWLDDWQLRQDVLAAASAEAAAEPERADDILRALQRLMPIEDAP